MGDENSFVDPNDSASGVSSAFGSFEETGCKVHKGTGRLNCIIDVIGETKPMDKHTNLVVVIKTRKLTENGIVIKETRCQFPIEAFNSVNEVTKYLKDVTSSNIICSLSMVDLKTYLEMKYETYMAHGVPRLFNSAEYLGLQNNGTIVFSRQFQVAVSGEVLSAEDESVFLVAAESENYVDQYTQIMARNGGDNAQLTDLFSQCKVMFQHNYSALIASLAAMSYMIAYPIEIRYNRSVPTILLHSTACATGKSTAMTIATMLHGQPNSVLSKLSDAALKRRSHYSALPTVLDDIQFNKDLDNHIVNRFTGVGECDTKSRYCVRSGMYISSNSSIREREERVISKVIIIGFQPPTISPKTSKQYGAFKALDTKLEAASAVYVKNLAILLKRFVNLTTFDRMQLQDTTERVFASGAGSTIHQRIVTGYSNLLFFIKEILKLVDRETQPEDVLTDICASIREDLCATSEPNVDGVQAFFEKLLSETTQESRRQCLVVTDSEVCVAGGSLPSEGIRKMFQELRKDIGMIRVTKYMPVDETTSTKKNKKCHAIARGLVAPAIIEQLSPRNITETPLEANNDTSAESASDPQAVGAQAIMDISQVQSEQQTQGERFTRQYTRKRKTDHKDGSLI